jgi:WD40 repeat protein
VLEKKLTGHTGVVKWVIPFGDECLLSGANDSVVGLWNIESGEMQRIMTGHTGWLNAGALLTTPNDPIQLLVTGSEDGTVRIFRIDTGEKLFQLECTYYHDRRW